jgi:hypothetical protein
MAPVYNDNVACDHRVAVPFERDDLKPVQEGSPARRPNTEVTGAVLAPQAFETSSAPTVYCSAGKAQND